MLQQMRVESVLGTRGTSGAFTNVFLYRHNQAIGHESYFRISENVVAALGTVFTNKISTYRVTNTQVMEGRQTEQQQRRFMRFNFNEVGKRVAPGGVDAASLNHVAQFNKEARFGDTGRQLIRGAFLEDEVEANPQGSVALVAGFNVPAFNNFGQALLDAFSSEGATLVLPAPPGASFEAGARPVVEVLFAGLSLRQLTQQRRSLPQKLKDLAKAEIAELERQASIEAARSGNDNPDSWNPLVLQALMAAAGLLLSRYGGAILVATGLNRFVRALLARIP
jgi:hypothetical protein